MNRFVALGDRLRRAQDALLDGNSSTAEARTRLLSPELATSRRTDGAPARRGRAGGAAVVVGVALATAAGLALWHRTPAPLAFDVGGGAVAGARRGNVGEWMATPPAEVLPVRFTDGSSLRLEGGTQARVTSIASSGASIVLERGALHASVVHRADTKWDVQAGPFEVRVTGTAFRVAWDPVTDAFTIALEEGKVMVSGCALGEERAVSAGETYQATCRGGHAKPQGALGTATTLGAAAPPAPASFTRSSPASDTPGAPESPSPSVIPAATVDAPTPVSAPGPQPAPSRDRPSADPSGPWRALFEQGKYREAIDAAEGRGFATVCSTSSAADLMNLADAARLSDRTDEAELVLREVRRRFPSDARAGEAAFYLGRIAFDRRSSYPEAARWFETSLREQPHGDLSREAQGRLFEALELAGDHDGARGAATRYLETYPDGPHAVAARRLAGR